MKPNLVVLAAGMGSRFGGLKQMEAIGPSGEWILDYSLYDAARAGFGKAIFVIREEMEADFTQAMESKRRSGLEFAYCFQQLGDLPGYFPLPPDRSKPWGTGHAVHAARHCIDAPFAVVNADDFYGRAAYEALASFLSEKRSGKALSCALVGYALENVLSERGHVSRGICRTDAEGNVISIEEHSQIQRNATTGCIEGLDASGKRVTLPDAAPASMNCWAFPRDALQSIESLLDTFLKERGKEPQSEFYLPAAVDAMRHAGQASVKALQTRSPWIGITHRDDLADAKQRVEELAARGDYPRKLFVD